MREGWRERFAELPNVELDAPLAPRVAFRIGGPADVFIKPTSAEELARVESARRVMEACPAGGAIFFNNLHFGVAPGRGAQTEDGTEAPAYEGAAADEGGEETAAADGAAPHGTQEESGDGNLWNDFVGRRRRCMLAGVQPPCMAGSGRT